MDYNCRANFDADKKAWRVAISGEIDIYNSQTLKDSLGKLIAEHAVDIYLDCEKLEYIDSTGLGALVAMLKKVRQFGGNFHLVNVKASILKIFKITDLDKVFVIEGEAHE